MVKFQPSKLAMRVRFPLPAIRIFIGEMSAGVAVITFFTLASVFVPGLPETYRRWIFYGCVALLFVSIVWWLLAHRTSPITTNGRVDVRARANQRGHIQAAGRDAIHTVRHHYQSHAEPLGMRIDVSALRDLKKHRDLGEKMFDDIKRGDGESRSRWGEIDAWWSEAITKSNQNAFAPFLSLSDLERLKQPWPESDKLRAVANAIDNGRINNTGDDIRFYGTMWERLERLRQLIGLIDADTND
jgi:hypothetical protein